MWVTGANGGAWRPLFHEPFEDADAFGDAGFDSSDSRVYITDIRGRDTTGLYAVDLTTGVATLLAGDARADIGEVHSDPTDFHVQAVSVNYDRPCWLLSTNGFDFNYLGTVSDGDLHIDSRSMDDRRWIVRYEVSDGPHRFYRYDRGPAGQAGKASFLFAHRKSITAGLKLSRMRSVVIPSRDGLSLVSYLTVPLGADPDGRRGDPSRPVPLVVLVHGGPNLRDEWGFSTQSAVAPRGRGYAVLNVNYRGRAASEGVCQPADG